MEAAESAGVQTERQGCDLMNPRDNLERVYDASAPKLYRYALMILADPAAAEDAVQQAFVKYARGRSGACAIEHLEGYLRIAVRNECRRILKRKGSRREIGLESAPLLEAASTPLPDEDERRALEQALRQLPAEQREVVHMKVYEDMTFQRIAEILGISINTAASRYRYALDRLRQLLTPDHPTEGPCT
jgi:RNA polymerase sigma-70 factor, ECF subfamily